MNPAPAYILAGGGGFLGGVLARHWHAAGRRVVVLARRPESCARRLPPGVEVLRWDGVSPGAWTQALEGAAVLVNLAGRSVDCRYHARNRAEILASRVDSTRLLADALANCRQPPPLWLNSSSATIYRHAEDRGQDERSGELGEGFSVDVCRAWEAACLERPLPGVRRVLLRTAIVLGREGGVYPVFARLARLGLGGTVAGGRQMFSWLHETDFARAVDELCARPPERDEAINLSAPCPVPLARFQRDLRRSLRVPVGLPLPGPLLHVGAWIIRTEPELLLKSRWVLPRRLMERDFRFVHPSLPGALATLARV